MTARPLRCAIIGLGARGRSFVKRLTPWPDVEITWLVDRSTDRAAAAGALAAPATPRLAGEARDALADAALDAVLIATPDRLHVDQAIGAFAAGKHVFLEKPMALSIADARAILSARARAGRVLRLGYVLREAPFYRAIRDALAEGRIGRVLSARLTDDLSLVHGASYRRRWHRRSDASGGLMVHKGCHDLDLVCWLLDSRPTRIASFAGADLFARPAPAPFCSTCPERAVCPYVDTGAYEARTRAEAADPTGHGLDVCVFGEASDLVDRQVIAFEMACGVRGVFSLAMGSPGRSERTISLLGETGRIDGVFGEGRWTLTPVGGGTPIVWTAPPEARRGHAGGDEGVLRAFVAACADPTVQGWTTAQEEASLDGLAFALAAEMARERGAMVSLGAEAADITASSW